MIKDKELLDKIPKVIMVNDDSWCNTYELSYIDKDVCYYIDNDEENALYIDTKEMAHSRIDEVGRYELAENFLFVDPEWDQQVFFDICKKFKENKPHIFMTDEMKYNIECSLNEDLEI